MFQVGDIVVGIKSNPYNFTGVGSVCEVIEAPDDGRIRVEIIKSAPDTGHKGSFWVDASFFELKGTYHYTDEDFEMLLT